MWRNAMLHQIIGAYHLNSLNRDNYQFWVSLPYIFWENNFRMQVIAYLHAITTAPRYNIYAI